MLQQAFEDAPFFGLSFSAWQVSVQEEVCLVASCGSTLSLCFCCHSKTQLKTCALFATLPSVDGLDMALETAALAILTTLSSADGFDEVSIPSKAILAACAGTRWLHAHWELPAVRVLGPRMLPILYAMYDTIQFCFVLIVSVCAAGSPNSIVENSLTLPYRLLVAG